jgi:polyisoprenoid-binding protein YceI
VRVYKDPSTVAAGLSHDHAIASTQHSGTVSYDPANPAACAISVTVPVAGLDPDPDALRQKVGLPGVIEASARAEIKEHMLDAEQLNAKAFPTITFVITRPTSIGAGGRFIALIHPASAARSAAASPAACRRQKSQH